MNMQAIYEKLTDFIIAKLRGKTLEYIIIMTLLGGIFFLQYHYLSQMVLDKNDQIERMISDFEETRKERDAYLRSYIDCEKSGNAQIRAQLESIERMLQRRP